MRETQGVEELHGFEVAEGGTDVRGWEVVSGDGRRVGEVVEVLAETGDRSARYFQVQLDPRPAGGAAGTGAAGAARHTGEAVDVGRDAIPELDRLSEHGEVIGHVAVPGDGPPEVPARTMGEALVRDSLLDVENRMTAGSGPGFDRGRNRVLIPAGQARLDTAARRIRIDSLPAGIA